MERYFFVPPLSRCADHELHIVHTWCNDEILWKKLFERDFPFYYTMHHQKTKKQKKWKQEYKEKHKFRTVYGDPLVIEVYKYFVNTKPDVRMKVEQFATNFIRPFERTFYDSHRLGSLTDDELSKIMGLRTGSRITYRELTETAACVWYDAKRICAIFRRGIRREGRLLLSDKNKMIQECSEKAHVDFSATYYILEDISTETVEMGSRKW